MRGILNLNKPTGITSRALVDRVVRLCPQIKVGHAGTLDPLASGVLLVCLGPATRLIDSLLRTCRRSIARCAPRGPERYARCRRPGRRGPGSSRSDRNVLRRALAAQVGEIRSAPAPVLRTQGQRTSGLRPGPGWPGRRPGARLVRIDRADLFVSLAASRRSRSSAARGPTSDRSRVTWARPRAAAA